MSSHNFLQVQQTPNPFAQVPALEPPLFVHSDLENKFWIKI